LELLEAVFSYYLTGVANIRGSGKPEDYTFELLLAGYDPDGTPEIGRLVLGAASEATSVGPLLKSVTQQRSVFPIVHRQIICVNGIRDVADMVLGHAGTWMVDPAMAGCERSTNSQELLSVDQMKALAISLKERTADRYREVGGPNQIATLTNGRLQPIEQPAFRPIPLSGYRFAIVATITVENVSMPGQPESRVIPGRPTGQGVSTGGLFGLYFRDKFTHVRQELGDAYYGGNVFRDCLLTYSGGRLQFAKSNQVVDSDLEIAAEAPRDSPELNQLLHDFSWRTVTYLKTLQPTLP
jgi:hypothetical protein